MAEVVLINVTQQETRVALIERNLVQEILIERNSAVNLHNNIYKGRVKRILPGIQAAFVDIGLKKAGFLHFSDINIASSSGTDIRDCLAVGQELLVQVYKDPLSSKSARLTTQLTLPGRYVVLTPTTTQITVSQKISDEAERNRLKAIPTGEYGFIVRTAAVGVNFSEIESEIKYLNQLWKTMLAKAKQAKVGELIFQEIPLYCRVVRDMMNNDTEKILIDEMDTYQLLQRYIAENFPVLISKIEHYKNTYPIFDLYQTEDQIQKALSRKIFLKSGGHLIFDQTEAMTTIDINTGSYLGVDNLEQTIFKINTEAVEMIARQIRLRNLGGIIIIDFIDMNNEHHKEYLLQLLSQALAKDPVKTQISELSSLGLVQMTRKRVRESLEHILCEPCRTCHQRGSLKSIETVCLEISREIQRTAQMVNWPGFLILAAPNITASLTERYSTIVNNLTMQLQKPIKIQSAPDFMQEHYNILPYAEEKASEFKVKTH